MEDFTHLNDADFDTVSKGWRYIYERHGRKNWSDAVYPTALAARLASQERAIRAMSSTPTGK